MYDTAPSTASHETAKESEVMSDAAGAGGVTASGSGTVGSSSEQEIPPPAKMKSSRYGNNFFITCGIKELKIFDG